MLSLALDASMFADALRNGHFRQRLTTICTRTVILGMLVACGSLVASRDVSAGAGMGAAAASAAGALSSCGSNSGKSLYNCVANVLDRMSGDISAAGVPATQGALRSAASKLRAAANKSQALSAISQCRALISAAIRKVQTIGSSPGWASGDGSGLEAISGVLSQAAALIQSKG